ncbi:hypothetical protein Poli38472_004134 [Pythium oligandrum]|uniref:Disease resistance R13L4/SHOC-2-like LRR domain-containing protein n=1 Tax=Pythium oligandrum TaxID=41045 RepID=A0A8K1CMS5_PYTOL|nr:hypothetical protein Poli38472_004134 [Pythium oligandrum]|eukprot:TMW66369.1 hypothetical protein Poli38472_004134 [Pythium oligandrum]
MDKDEKKWECVDLVKIDLSHNAIPSISDEIGALATVSSIKLCQNTLTSLPEGLFELTALTYLDLSHNQLQGKLSEGFGALVNLKELGLAANKLQTLPDAIGNLSSLEVLRIEENALIQLPARIGQLRRLHTLTAHTNQLAALPTSFSELRSLQTLDLRKNRLDTMSGQLSTLQSLKFLDLRQNKIVVFPNLPQSAALDQVFLGYNALAQIDEDSILRAKDSMTVLELRDNKLSLLPANIACLYRLKTLDLSNNDLSDLPPGLGYLKHLNHLVIDGNPLRAIRRSVLSAGCEAVKKYLRTRGGPPSGVDVLEEEIDELQVQRERERLVKAASSAIGTRAAASASTPVRNQHVYREAASSGTLDLTDQVLQSIPREVSGDGAHNFSSTLLHLNLSKNHLTRLPEQISGLVSLMSLTVEENQLQTVDPSIATLPRLQLLRLRKNQLTTNAVNEFLANEESSLGSCIKELDLRNNQLTQMPSQLRQLASMETLLLSFNKIESLDGFPWHELGKVSVVSISDNRLKSLGQIYHTPMLASLSFENNNLTQVPCELGLCPHLRAIYMNANPQKTVRGGVMAKGSLEIIMYLKNKLPINSVLTPPTSWKESKAMAVQDAIFPVKSNIKNRPKLNMYAATADDPESVEEEDEAEVVPTLSRISSHRQHEIRSPQDTGGDSKGSSTDLATIDGQIASLEQQLDNQSGLSAAKRYALKKELALLRSSRIREARKVTA